MVVYKKPRRKGYNNQTLNARILNVWLNKTNSRAYDVISLYIGIVFFPFRGKPLKPLEACQEFVNKFGPCH